MKYNFVKQHDATDCAAACLAMICLYYKKETTITKLRDLMGTDLKGTNLLGLNSCAEKLGFVSQAVRVDRDGFQSKFSLPAIANVITKEGFTHFVVVYKITDKYVIIGDPAKDVIKVKLDEFYEGFTGVLLLLKPGEEFVQDSIKGEKVISRFIRIAMPQKKLFIYTVISSIIMTILGVISSLFNKIIMDEVVPYKLKNTLLVALIIFAIISITQVVIGFVRQVMMLFLSQKIDIPLMLGYFEHVYKLPIKFFSTRKTGDIITRFSDAFTIKNIFTNIALTLVLDVFMALSTGVILFKMNSILFSIILFMTIISIILVYIFKRPYKRINEEQMQQESILNSEIIEGLRAVETIKGNANEETELENIEREYIKSLRISFKEGMLSNIQGTISQLITMVGNLVLMYFSVIQVIENNITLGSMMAFMTLSGYFMEPVGRIVGLQLQIQEANISMKRMSEILDYEVEQDNSDRFYREIEKVDGEIKFENVTFRYGNRNPVLNNISFVIPKGKKVALVGGSGSGKSTIAKLLLKYYEVESGEITIDDVNINEYDNYSIRKAISYVPQTIELFSKSIYDNIRMSKMDSTIDEVIEVAKIVDAHEFIKKLPRQYNTFLEESGKGLSGGERQRIALARAFLKKNEFYILDESTSSLDFATENVIFDMIYNKFRNKSMLIVAHRLATIKNCDEILVMDKGKIVEKGTHEYLLNKKGYYYNLWEMQQGNFIRKESKDVIEIDNKDIDNENEMTYL